MNIFTNTKKTKKFILILVLLMLFSFCYPKQVKAFDFGGNISGFFFMLEKGIINFVNDIFCDAEHEFELTSPDPKKQQVNFTAENIIKGKFILFDADIFKKIDANGDYYDKFDWLVGDENSVGGDTGKHEEGAKVTLRNTISGWYYSLRNFAIVALLSVLVYVGIRMITSTISQDKAKYKIMFKDWLVALCLLIVMHYIMIGILNVTSMVTDAIGIDGGGGTQTGHFMSLINNINDNPEKGKLGETRYIDDNGKPYTLEDAFAYELLLLAIILLTFLFAYKYMKREFTIIFLILLGPISCITYPIDKISDGKAQAFNKWLTEFIYNVLVQPFHLLLYTVLCGSAIELANQNILYGLACLAMLIPAEKFIKEMFGFKDHLGGGPLAAATTGAVASQLMNKVKGLGSEKSSGGSGGSEKDRTTPERVRNRTVDPSVLTDGQTGSGTPETEGDNTPPINGEEDETPEAEGDNNLPINGGDENPETEGDNNLPINGEEDKTPGTEGNNNPPINRKEGEIPGTEGNNNPQTDKEENRTKRNIKAKVKGDFSKLKNHYDLEQAKRYHTTDKKQIRKIKAKKGAKIALKVTGGIVGATVGAAVGLLSGKGIVAGAATGSALGGKVYKAAEKVGNKVGGYRNVLRTPEQRNEHAEKLALKDFKENNQQIDRAILDFREKNGRDPSNKELNEEMTDRYELSRYGLSDDQIDNTIDLYKEIKTKNLEEDASKLGINTENLKEQASGNNVRYRELLEESIGKKNNSELEELANRKKIDTKKLKEQAEGSEDKYKKLLMQALKQKNDSIAGSKAKYTADLAKSYSEKDFREAKTMSAGFESIWKGLKANNPNCTEQEAQEAAREYLINAAKMKGISTSEIALPPIKEKVTIPTRDNMYGKLKFGNDATSESQKQQVKAIQNVLVEIGLEDNQIKQVMDYSTGNNNEEIITSFAKNVKYIISNDIKTNSTIQVGEIKSGQFKQNIVKEEVTIKENLEKLDLSKKTGITDEKVLSKMRELEEKNGTTQFRAEGGKMIRGEYSKNDKNNLSEKALEMAEGYKRATTVMNPNTSKKKQSRNKK